MKVEVVYKGTSQDGSPGKRVFILSGRENEAAALEALIRASFSLPPKEEIMLILNDNVVCYPIHAMAVEQLAAANSIELRTFVSGNSQKSGVRKTGGQRLNASVTLQNSVSPLTDSRQSFLADHGTQKDDKRKNNRGLDHRRSYVKEEKLLVMLLKDLGNSAEDIHQMSQISKANIEKWCSDKTRQSLLDKYRMQSTDGLFARCFSTLQSVHFDASQDGNIKAVVAQLLGTLRVVAPKSTLLALWDEGGALIGLQGRLGLGTSWDNLQLDHSNDGAADRVANSGGYDYIFDDGPGATNDLYVANILTSLQPEVEGTSQKKEGGNSYDAGISRAPTDNVEGEDESSDDDEGILEMLGERVGRKRKSSDAISIDKSGRPSRRGRPLISSQQVEDLVMQYNLPPFLFDDGDADDSNNQNSGGMLTSTSNLAYRPLLSNTIVLRRVKKQRGGEDDDEDSEVMEMLGE